MKIFDCFTFYNELDILELRLKEHWDHVDYFVISEANLTHQGNPVAKLDKNKGMTNQQITMYDQNDIDSIQREMIIKYHHLID